MNTFPQDYSKHALPRLAQALLSQFSPMTALWFLWLINKNLPKPLTEDELYYICKDPQSWIDGTQLSVWERESFRYTPALELDKVFSQTPPPQSEKMRRKLTPVRYSQSIPGAVKKRQKRHAKIEVAL
jgi:hypothetical protein